MQELVDWNCHLLPGMRESVASAKQSMDALFYLYRTYGINRFCMMPHYDPTYEPLSVFKLRVDAAKEQLKLPQRSPIRICCHPRVYMIPDLHLCEDIEKLQFGINGYLPLVLPTTEAPDYFNYEINRLLYKRHFKLWFTDFEKAVLLYPPETIEQLCRIKDTVFQFGWRSLCEPSVRECIKKMIKRKVRVVFGSSVSSLENAHDFRYLRYQKTATDSFTAAAYQSLILRSSYLWYL